MPAWASTNSPTVGPTMREALDAPTSSDIAMPIRSDPTASPIITRRTGLSVAQPRPLRKLVSARCQTSSIPAWASTHSTAELVAISTTTPISTFLRSNFSAQAPRKAPSSPIGSRRSMVIMATRKALSVRS